jgi:hypothetical protein
MIAANIVAILLLLLVAYVWSARGFFSSLLNLLVTIAAGAIAFAFWESMAGTIMKGVASDNRIVIDVAWGGSLLTLFIVSLAVLSLAVNAVVRANIKVHKAVDWIGGAVCGLGAGLIVSGFAMIGTSQIRTAEIDNLMGFQPIDYTNEGYLVRTDLWVPVDTMTAGLYKFWSDRSLRETFGGGKTLAAWRPQVADEGHLLRMAESDVLLRYALSEKDVDFNGRYTVGLVQPKGAKEKPPTLKELVGVDKKAVAMVDRTPIDGQAYVEGFVVTFHSSAKEKGGQVAVGAGSATLVVRNEANDRSISLQPIAVVSQAKGDARDLGRWRFDTRNFFVGTVGGQANAPMAFEFLVPNNNPNDPQEKWHPIALYVRGVRFNLTDENGDTIKASQDYWTVQDRDGAIEAQVLLDTTTPIKNTPGQPQQLDPNDANRALKTTNRIPDNMTLNGGELSGVELNKGQQIINCVDLRLQPKQLADNSVERSLRVEEFQPGPGTAVISINVSRDMGKWAATEPESTGATGAPTIVDHLGQRYEAIGYVYRDRNEIRIRFTPGSPLLGLAEAPAISRSRDDQKLFLIFRLASGVKIKQYSIGTTGIVDLKGDIEVPLQTNK